MIANHQVFDVPTEPLLVNFQMKEINLKNCTYFAMYVRWYCLYEYLSGKNLLDIFKD